MKSPLQPLQKYRDVYYEASASASEHSRNLAFAGIAILWLFKVDDANTISLPGELLLPAKLFVTSLGLDLLQYVYKSAFYGAFVSYHESIKMRSMDYKTSTPGWVNYPTLILFWGKLFTIFLAYYYLIVFLNREITLLRVIG